MHAEHDDIGGIIQMLAPYGAGDRMFHAYPIGAAAAIVESRALRSALAPMQ
jgi:hypothetical protein